MVIASSVDAVINPWRELNSIFVTEKIANHDDF